MSIKLYKVYAPDGSCLVKYATSDEVEGLRAYWAQSGEPGELEAVYQCTQAEFDAARARG